MSSARIDVAIMVAILAVTSAGVSWGGPFPPGIEPLSAQEMAVTMGAANKKECDQNSSCSAACMPWYGYDENMGVRCETVQYQYCPNPKVWCLWCDCVNNKQLVCCAWVPTPGIEENPLHPGTYTCQGTPFDLNQCAYATGCNGETNCTNAYP